ncbi:MAG: FtsX-like permease family protein [Desulfobacterales bacterium]|nr:MAG: FtsX-like permease family protein [Desulfobacterales bacterium]
MRWIEKQKNILDYTLSSLFRRKGKNMALIVVYTVVIFTLASVMFFTYSIKQEAAQLLKDAPEMVVQRLVMGRHDLIPISYIGEIKKIWGVQAVEPRLWGYYYDPVNGANYTLMVSQDFNHESGKMAIGNGVARNLLAKENGTIPFKTYDGSYHFLKIKDILSADSELVSSDLILVSEEDFKKIFAISDEYATDLVLKVRNANELNTIATKITQIFPDTRPVLRNEILSTYDAVFDWRGGVIIVIFAAAVLAFIILAWDKATGLSAEEKREIGILKALGWETSDVLLMKYWEGVVVSLSSFILGVLLAYLHVFFTSSAVFAPALKGWSVLYPKFRLTPYLNAYQIATLFFLTVIPYTVATIVPSWRASTIDPDSVMRT